MSRSEASASRPAVGGAAGDDRIGRIDEIGPAGQGAALAAVAALDARVFPDLPLGLDNLALLSHAARIYTIGPPPTGARWAAGHSAGPGDCRGYALLVPTFVPGRVLLYSLGSDPVWRGRGLARRLLRVAVADLATEGWRELVLTVAPENQAAVGLYRSEGFEVLAELPDHPRPGATRLLLRLPLARGKPRGRPPRATKRP